MDASSPAPLGLPRERRIKQGRDFARAKVQGRRLAQGCLILNWVDLPPTDLSRLGVITGRKIGHAVIRSRASIAPRSVSPQSTLPVQTRRLGVGGSWFHCREGILRGPNGFSAGPEESSIDSRRL
ncbi:MAG: ribonuclease P protein component [Verrucomicrobia bacterium]|nr:ribonuclease P protein component [Verrucomicrobiota bacterium]